MNQVGHIRFASRTRELRFSSPVEIIAAATLDEIVPGLARVAAGVARGCHAAGFLSYEAAPAFDPALRTRPAGDLPLLWFGLYRDAERRAPAPARPAAACEVGPWTPLVSAAAYRENIRRIRELIAAGDTYQVNYTFPMQAAFKGDAPGWFDGLCAAQQADYCAFLDLGRWQILSASPELFFRLQGNLLTTRPMKGTRPRGRWPAEDRSLRQALAASDKDRAENVMIVDLLRNDLARISASGPVRVQSLFDIEAYPTVWQMTSTICSRTRAAVPEIIRALFPSGSVTGAPKIRTMEIIRELEPWPRGVYCGAIGWWAPDGRAEFNVAIRTVALDARSGRALYHVGSGVTYGSSAADEYEECLLKASLLTRRRPEFELLETLRYAGAFFLLAEHLDRLAASAGYFGFACDRPAIEKALAAAMAGEADGPATPWKSPAPAPSEEGNGNPPPHPGGKRNLTPLPGGAGGGSSTSAPDGDLAPLPGGVGGGFPSPVAPFKVRLLLRKDGAIQIQREPLAPPATLRVGFAVQPVDAQDIFLYHKTTRRAVYQQALADRPDCDDVLLWNARGEITESTIANVVLDLDGLLWTPPLESGLLEGVFRRHLLATGVIRERVLAREDVRRARAVWLINSVRHWINVRWVDDSPEAGTILIKRA